MLQVRGLRKCFGERVAVDDVSFSIEAGEIYGLLGPNGAGKTTSISMIAGILARDAGEVTIDGINIDAGPPARALIGIVPQSIALYTDLTARENLNFWGRMYDLSEDRLRLAVENALSAVGLTPRADDIASTFSGGMQRRLNLACGILHQPKLLVLDEPTVGVDPQSRVRLLDLVRAEARAGTCVLYTTHYMEEAEALCDRLAIVDHGKVIAAGTLGELRSMLAERDLLRLTGVFAPQAARAAIQHIDSVEILQADESLLLLSLVGASQKLPEIFAALGASGAEVRGTTLTQPSLESLFIKLTGKELRE